MSIAEFASELWLLWVEWHNSFKKWRRSVILKSDTVSVSLLKSDTNVLHFLIHLNKVTPAWCHFWETPGVTFEIFQSAKKGFAPLYPCSMKSIAFSISTRGLCMPLDWFLPFMSTWCGYLYHSTRSCACVDNIFMVWWCVLDLLQASTLRHGHFSLSILTSKGVSEGLHFARFGKFLSFRAP